MPYRPTTKGKVEKTMNKIDDLGIYNWDIKDLLDLNILLKKLTKEFNYRKNDSTQFPPELLLKSDVKEMVELAKTPLIAVYRANLVRALTVDSTGTVKHRNSYYSVPYALRSRKIYRQEINDKLYLYYNGIVVATHKMTGAIINKYDYCG